MLRDLLPLSRTALLGTAPLRLAPVAILAACVGFLTVPSLGSADQTSAPERIEFNRDIRPILSDQCFYCHGPDANHRQADLRLDDRDAAYEHGAVVAGDPAKSGLIERVFSDDSTRLMPPPESNKKLTAEQKELLRRWIEQGAEYQNHWAYEPVLKPEVPLDGTAIDTLVRARLEKHGLQPSPPADRRTLIRRLYSDLVGIPPRPEEVEAFVADAAPDAYEQLVERLLANEHYGERMAMQWLDVVRFADTIGYHSDNPRNIWPYRDYVIRAFNQNKPFDRFTIEQIAGDLLPDATQETRVASGFNRLLLTTEEGGAQPKDYEARMLADRVRAIGTVWLGQTTGCAQCHDHKFDPIAMRDFYALGAFFADIQEGIIAPREEGMAVMTDAQRARLSELDEALNAAKKRVAAIANELDAAQKAWETSLVESEQTLPELAPNASADDAQLKLAKSVAAGLRAEKRTPQQQQDIQRYFRGLPTAPFTEERSQLATAEKARNDYYRTLPKTLVTRSTDKKRTVRLLPRGNWMDDTGEIIRPALPSYLPALGIAPSEGSASGGEVRELNRLDLARWLVAPGHPLTARVTMNRLWKQFFGTGLSKVLDDLGAQGEPPVHPELLDYLAAEFVEKGWDIKHMVRRIVSSQTYRQTSAVTPELLARDPYNREHARQTAFRMDAELIRDYALSVSHLLNDAIGGPSIKPYQPDGYWENLNFPQRTYSADLDRNQYRRGLYVWWQRSFLHPSLLAFDAPTREECCAERTRSNIPQQALVLMNDPTYMEAARNLAVRILREADGSSSLRIRWAVRQVLQREARDEEVETLLQAFSEHHAQYSGKQKSAFALLQHSGQSEVPSDLNQVELAAWTHVARILLNLHETITRN